MGKNGSDVFRKVCESLGENDRKMAKSYTDTDSTVYVAKIVNPKSGKIQYRIELKMDDEFKPFAVVKSTVHFEKLKKFIKWLEDHRDYLSVLDELNAVTKRVATENVEDF